MSSNNHCSLTGNLVRDPELRFTMSGRAVANGRIAVTDRFQQTDGSWGERTTFVNIVAWGDLAEQMAVSLEKGDHITVVGELRIRDFVRTDGTKQYVTEINCSNVSASLRFTSAQLDRKPKAEQAEGTTVVVDQEDAPFV